MRVPLHEHFHVSVTSCQRAEVKRVLHCDATTSADMDALLSKKLPAAGIDAPQQLQIYLTFFVAVYNFGPTITAIIILTASPGRYGITPMKRPSLKVRLISFASQTVPKI